MLMRLLDRQFRKYLGHYIIQSLMAAAVLAIILAVLHIEAHLAIIASMGASTFVVFAMPRSVQAQPRSVVGGHTVGLLSGSLSYLPFLWLSIPSGAPAEKLFYVLAGALAVGLAIFLMSITNTEHAPAAGTALGIVVHGVSWQAAVFVIVCAVGLSLARWLLRGWLRDLV